MFVDVDDTPGAAAYRPGDVDIALACWESAAAGRAHWPAAIAAGTTSPPCRPARWPATRLAMRNGGVRTRRRGSIPGPCSAKVTGRASAQASPGSHLVVMARGITFRRNVGISQGSASHLHNDPGSPRRCTLRVRRAASAPGPVATSPFIAPMFRQATPDPPPVRRTGGQSIASMRSHDTFPPSSRAQDRGSAGRPSNPMARIIQCAAGCGGPRGRAHLMGDA